MRRLGTQVGTQVGGVASNACHDTKAKPFNMYHPCELVKRRCD